MKQSAPGPPDGPETEPRVSLDTPGSIESGDVPSEVVQRLSGRRTIYERYARKGEVGRGAQGEILRVWDHDLRRNLAMKVVLGKTDPITGETPPPDGRSLGRFLEEAQVTGQLDHPGVVPVHELGLDPEGRLFFTMKLVKGRHLKAIFELVRERAEGWTQTRALSVLLKVCEAMAYAHAKGVIHRDLKPGNVMVGRYGEVYVMDWGLARVLEHEDAKDIRIRPEETVFLSDERHEDGSLDSPLITMDGDIVGTPAYMAPEQARGELSKIGPPTDVYALGAMLYQLLAGHMPYAERGTTLSNHAILYRVQRRSPKPVAKSAPDAPAELVAICEKAMARDPQERYRDMSELAADLSAYLEHRVVHAYRSGALIEFRKWVGRNRLAAATIVAAFVVLAASGFAVAWTERRRAEEIRGHSDLGWGRELLLRAEDLGHVQPDFVEERERWLAEAEESLGRAPRYRAQLAELRSRALPIDEEGLRRDREEHPDAAALRTARAKLRLWQEALERNASIEDADPAWKLSPADEEVLLIEIEQLRPDLEILEERVNRRRTYAFEDDDDQRSHAQLAALARMLERLGDPRDGAVQRVRRDLERARDLERVSIHDEQERWERAIADIADRTSCPDYDGLRIVPQLGLVPIGRDPESGLWEFWHVLSGEEPERGGDGELRVAWNTGIVLTLLPGGHSVLGAQAESSSKPNYDPSAHGTEGPLLEVELDPFFFSKYELTQGQWIGLAGTNPSERWAGKGLQNYGTVSRTHPVETVSWNRGHDVLLRVGLDFPTEAQWEYACRAGSDTAYWWEEDFAALEECVVNYLDQSAQRVGFRFRTRLPPVFDDGHPLHAPVDAFPVNSYGLHAVSGNVWEWCRDDWIDSYDEVVARAGDGLLETEYGLAIAHPVRGGAFDCDPFELRSARRGARLPDYAREELGIRPARKLER